jgi:peptide/nickel transport system substrate-binding protein
MKRSWMVLTTLFALSASAQEAKPFVYPQAWSVAKPSDAKRGGTMRIPLVGTDFRTFNPFIVSEATNIPDIISAGGLVTRDPVSGDWVAYMAESFTVSSNKLVYTFKIRRGLKWSDGKAITADDWITTWRIHTDEKVGSQSLEGFFINDKPIKISKTDDYTLVMSFPAVDAIALTLAAFDPWPDHIFAPVYKAKGAEGIKAMWGLNIPLDQLVASGPWIPETYRPGERMVLKRNAAFGEWNKDAANGALPYAEKLEYLVVKDSAAQLAAFLAGNIDFYNPTTVDQISQVRRAVQANQLDANLKLNASAVDTTQTLIFNWNKTDAFKRNLFRSDKFRRAMSHLVNRQAIVEVVYGGLGTPNYTSVSPARSQWVNTNATKFDYDIPKATKLLSELGFTKKDGEGFLVDRSGKRLEFTLATNAGNTQREQMARLLSDDAKKAGVKINFTPIDFNVLVGQLTGKGDDRPWDAIIIGLGGGSLDWPFGTNTYACDGSFHIWNMSGKCIDARETQLFALFQRGRTELDVQRRRQRGFEMQEIQAKMQNIIYMAGPNFHVAWNNRVGGQFPDTLINAINGSRFNALSFVAK